MSGNNSVVLERHMGVEGFGREVLLKRVSIKSQRVQVAGAAVLMFLLAASFAFVLGSAGTDDSRRTLSNKKGRGDLGPRGGDGQSSRDASKKHYLGQIALLCTRYRLPQIISHIPISRTGCISDVRLRTVRRTDVF